MSCILRLLYIRSVCASHFKVTPSTHLAAHRMPSYRLGRIERSIFPPILRFSISPWEAVRKEWMVRRRTSFPWCKRIVLNWFPASLRSFQLTPSMVTRSNPLQSGRAHRLSFPHPAHAGSATFLADATTPPPKHHLVPPSTMQLTPAQYARFRFLPAFHPSSMFHTPPSSCFPPPCRSVSRCLLGYPLWAIETAHASLLNAWEGA